MNTYRDLTPKCYTFLETSHDPLIATLSTPVEFILVNQIDISHMENHFLGNSIFCLIILDIEIFESTQRLDTVADEAIRAETIR